MGSIKRIEQFIRRDGLANRLQVGTGRHDKPSSANTRPNSFKTRSISCANRRPCCAGANYNLVTAGGTLIQNGGTIFATSKIPTIAGTFSQTGGTYTSDQNLNITGALNQSGGLIHLAINTSTNPTDNLTLTGGDVTQSGGTIYTKDFAPTTGTFNQTGSGALLRIFHDWKPTSGHIFNATDGTAQFSGAPGNANFSSSSVQFFNVIADVDPTFGKVNNSTIKIRGSFTNNVAAGLVVTPSLVFRFNGSVPQTITSSAGTNITFSNLDIYPGGTVTLASNINMNGILTVRSGVEFNLSSFMLGAVTPPTSLILECGAVSGSSITGSGTLTLGGNVTVISLGTGNIGASISSYLSLGAANRIFTVADDGTSAPDLTVSGIISGAFNLTKEGPGRLVLSGSNSYIGTTTLTAGRVTLGAAGVIPDGSGIIFNGGTLKTGNTTGFSETAGSLTLNNSATIELGTGSHTLSFAASAGVSWPGTTTLRITGWTGGYDGTSGTAGKIKVGTTSGGLTSAQISRICFFNGSDYYKATILSDGEIVPLSSTFAPDNLSYTSPNYFNTGTAITPLNPSITGFVESYSVDPALPAGLTINTSTGIISGTPSVSCRS